MPARKLGTGLAVVAAFLSIASPASALTFDPVVTPATAVVGDTLTCDPQVDAQASEPTFTYEWVWLDEDPDEVIPGAPDAPQYVVTRDDVLHTVGCRVEGDDSDPGTVTETSDAGSAILQRPSVNATLTSPQISGEIGMDAPGVGVTAKLVRDDLSTGTLVRRVVAQASDTTDGNGAWSVDLGANAPSTGRDGVVIDYSGANAPPDAEYSRSTLDFGSVGGVAYATFPDPEGTTADAAQIFCPNCEKLEVSRNGGPFEDVPGSLGVFVYDPPGELTQADQLVAREYRTIPEATEPDSPTLAVMTRALRQVGSNEWGGPTCQADLATTVIRCRGAVRPAGGANPYVLRHNGGGNVATTFGTFGGDLLTEGNRNHGDFVTAKLPGLKAGDQVQLVRTDLARVLTTLRVGRLQAHVAEDGKISGQCTAGTWLDIWRQDDAAFMPVCPSNGEMDAQNYGVIAYDDTSGGRTEVRVPEITDLSPAQDGTVTGTTFTVKAATRYYADEVPGYLSTSDTVAVRITPAAGGSAIDVGNANGSGQSVTVPAPGKYSARWTVTDRNGDTRRIVTAFTVNPGAAGTTTGGTGTTRPPAARPPVARAAFVGGLLMKVTRFRAASRGGPIAGAAQKRKRKKAPIGTLVSYRLTSAATVGFAVQRKVTGRRSGRSCAKTTKKNRRKRTCKRTETLSTFNHAGKAGANSFRFTGRIKGRKLKPGRYTLAAAPSATGPFVSKAFTIVR